MPLTSPTPPRRESAHRSRMRKQARIEELFQEQGRLAQHNALLQEHLAHLAQAESSLATHNAALAQVGWGLGLVRWDLGCVRSPRTTPRSRMWDRVFA